METNVIYNEDCLEGMRKRIPDNSIDLIVNDPPYNIGKAEWDRIDNYIEWCGEWLKQCERVLKDNGSFYFFHNDFEVLVELQNWIKRNTDFVFRQLIVWNKRFKGARNKGFLDGFVEVNDLRNYQKMAEYCLYYTFQDETGLMKRNQHAVYPVREYIRNEIKRAKGKIVLKEVNRALNTATNGGGVASAVLSLDKSNPNMITKENYQKLRKWLNKNLKQEYKYLKQEYADLRYTFNNQKTHHSVWNYEIAPKQGHITPKPVEMIENILKHSSNENDIVLDCFGGSGTTAKACQNLNRQYILFETNEDYVKLIKDRLRQQSLFANVN